MTPGKLFNLAKPLRTEIVPQRLVRIQCEIAYKALIHNAWPMVYAPVTEGDDDNNIIY